MHNTTALAEQAPGFRKDIEGLRAVAILAVVAAHTGIPFLQGGFVGVDIFFVLSGYLITGLLVREREQTGSIDFLAFYARRFQRLLPALTLMVLLTALASTVLLAPEAQIKEAFTAQAAMMWMSNFYFAFSEYGYFDVKTSTSPFLHTWSLAVEEQFYLVWPLLIVLFMLTRPRRKPLLIGLVLVFVAALMFAITMSVVKPVWGFYMMPARGWQFALGALVFVWADKGYVCSGRASHVTGVVAMVLIGGSVVLFNESLIYPGFLALCPSLGVALLLLLGKRASPVTRLLSTSPMQALGKVSYSWYLWHWPVLVIGNQVFQRPALSFQLLLVLVSLLMATLAYYTVELPIRSSSALRLRPKTTALGALLIMVCGVMLGNTWISKAMLWAETPEQITFTLARQELPAPYADGCDSWVSSAALKPCLYGNEDSTNTVVLLGDSVGTQWFSALAKHYLDSGWRFVVLTKSACPIVDAPSFYERAGGEYLVCEEWRNAAVQYLLKLRPQIIFMGSAGAYEFDAATWVAGTKRILAPLSAVVEHVYVIRANSELAFDGPKCLARHDWQPAFIARLSACSSEVSTDPDNAVLAVLEEAAAAFANVTIVDFNALVCPGGICSAHSGEQIVYRDSIHLTDKFVRSISADVYSVIEKAK